MRPPKRDDPAARVADRDHQPAAETVVAVSPLIWLDQHAGLDQLVLAEACERGFELLRGFGREADAEAGDGCGVDAAALQIVAGLGAFDAAELLGEPVLAMRAMTSVSEAVRSALLAGLRVGRGDVEPGLARQAPSPRP